MNAFFAILIKEVVDNFRDRRTILSALLYGPVLMPLIMLGSFSVGLEKQSINREEMLTVYVHNIELDNLFSSFFSERNIQLKLADEEYKDKVLKGEYDIVMVVDDEFDRQFRSGEPADIWLYYNGQNSGSVSTYRRVKQVLAKYSQTILALRFRARGLDQSLLKPIQVIDRELGELNQIQRFLPRMLALIVMIAMTLGGFYLAVDACAGEKERRSFESLLALPVKRSVIAGAKLGAVFFYVFVSGMIALFVSLLLTSVLPLDMFSSSLNFSLLNIFVTVLLLTPLALLLSSLMFFLSSFSKTVKEAQTHLALIIFLPMLPFFVTQFFDLGSASVVWRIPVFAQFAFVENILSGGTVGAWELVIVSFLSIVVALFFLYLTRRRFESESMI
jgi:sodium transport system permease protein